MNRLLALTGCALQGDPSETIPKLVTDTKAALLVTDYSPLRLGRTWRSQASTRHAAYMHTPLPCMPVCYGATQSSVCSMQGQLSCDGTDGNGNCRQGRAQAN